MKRRPPAKEILTLAAVIACCSCSKKDASQQDASQTDTLIDASGKTVILARPIHRVISPFSMYTRLIVALGGCENLVGISHTCILPEEARGCGGELLERPDVGPFGRNMELIASLKPELIFASAPDVETFKEKTGAAVASVSFPHEMPMLDMFRRQIDLIGKALDKKDAADSLKDFIDEKLTPVISATKDMTQAQRPRAYFAWTSWTGDILNTVCEFDPIELAGGRNVAAAAGNFAKGERGILISREHIIKWDPEVIFVSRYQSQSWNKKRDPLPVSIADILSDPILKDVSAVKNRRIYYTTAFCNWWPHQRALVQILYMAKIFHPERFSNLDVEREGNEIFKRFYGEDGLYSKMASDLELHESRRP